MTLPLQHEIRPAAPTDAPVLGELIYLAAESNYPPSGYDLSLGGTREHQVAQLTRLAAANARSWFHYSHFTVAEQAGRVVAAIAAFNRTHTEPHTAPPLTQIRWPPVETQIPDAPPQPI